MNGCMDDMNGSMGGINGFTRGMNRSMDCINGFMRGMNGSMDGINGLMGLHENFDAREQTAFVLRSLLA